MHEVQLLQGPTQQETRPKFLCRRDGAQGTRVERRQRRQLLMCAAHGCGLRAAGVQEDMQGAGGAVCVGWWGLSKSAALTCGGTQVTFAFSRVLGAELDHHDAAKSLIFARKLLI